MNVSEAVRWPGGAGLPVRLWLRSLVERGACRRTFPERGRAQGLDAGRGSGRRSEGPRLHTPAKDSAERKAVLDALRPSVEKDLEQKVVIVIDHLAVKDGYAFLTGRPVQPDGKPIDYRKTHYREDLEEGVFDGNVSALFREEGAGWTVVTSAFGSTDVPWVSWPEKFHAPKEIFPAGVE